jgi:hypothetical protein
MAECHPVAFQWVMEAKARGAKVIHVDPRFTRTSAVADLYLPIRAGADIAFVGGLINYVLSSGTYFKDYVLAYTNAATILTEDYADTEDLDGVFSGLNREHRYYDFDTWRHDWVYGHTRLIIALTVAAALAAEGIYVLAEHGVTTVLGSGSDPFQPSVIPFNVGAITCGYLAGVALVRPGRSRRTQAVVRSGSDNAYGIYLSQMLFITALTWLGWGRLTSAIPWPLLCLLTVAIVFGCCVTLTSVLARTPLAVPLTGRKQRPWSTLMPRRRALDQIYPERAQAE